jgi:endoglucanase
MIRRFGLLAILSSLLVPFAPARAHADAQMDAAAINQAMSPGINYGNVLEAKPPEGWGLAAKEGDFAIMAAAGLKGVRIPVRWSAKAGLTPPYAIDPAFFHRVDSMVNAALRSGLYAVVNIHHYDELFAAPDANQERFLALWKQIAWHYSRYPRKLVFEILNEPHDALSPELWNILLMRALAEIRKTNPDRVVMIGAADYNGVGSLPKLSLPIRDKNLILTFHDYDPMWFTHQGADWIGEKAKAWLGTRWSNAPNEVRDMSEAFKKVRDYNRRYDLPVNLGEYGAYSKADMDSRVKWTRAMGEQCKKYGFSRFYWEFKSGFGAYDEASGKWHEELKDAIVQP